MAAALVQLALRLVQVDTKLSNYWPRRTTVRHAQKQSDTRPDLTTVMTTPREATGYPRNRRGYPHETHSPARGIHVTNVTIKRPGDAAVPNSSHARLRRPRLPTPVSALAPSAPPRGSAPQRSVGAPHGHQAPSSRPAVERSAFPTSRQVSRSGNRCRRRTSLRLHR
jgi:hypothetical protein